MIYVFKSCVDWEGSEIITATQNIPELIRALRKAVIKDRSFGEYCSLDYFDNHGDFIGSIRFAHSQIPGKSIDWRSKSSYDYLEDTPSNWMTLAKRILDEETRLVDEFASNKSML